MHFSLMHEQRSDGSWGAQVAEFPQLVAYGATKDAATEKAEMLALSALAEKRFLLNSDPGSLVSD
jgi:predicted RNase H-like HicB family nuclease